MHLGTFMQSRVGLPRVELYCAISRPAFTFEPTYTTYYDLRKHALHFKLCSFPVDATSNYVATSRYKIWEVCNFR